MDFSEDVLRSLTDESFEDAATFFVNVALLRPDEFVLNGFIHLSEDNLVRIENHLRGNDKIDRVSIKGYPHGDEMIRRICQSIGNQVRVVSFAGIGIKNPDYLHDLLLSHTIEYLTIKEDAIDFTPIAQALYHNTTLKYLSISPRRSSGLDALFDALNTNTTLLTLKSGHMDPQEMEMLCGCVNRGISLERLVVCDVEHTNIRPLFRSIVGTTITSFEVRFCRTFNEEDVCDLITKHTTLTNLVITDTKMTDLSKIFKVMETNKTIVRLSLSWVGSVDTKGLKEMMIRNRTLRRFIWEEFELVALNTITDTMEEIMRHNPVIESLTVLSIQSEHPNLERNRHNRKRRDFSLFEMMMEECGKYLFK